MVRETKSIWLCCSFRVLDELPDPFQEKRARGFQDLVLAALGDFDFVLISPVPEVGYVGAVAEFSAETAAPTHEVLRLDVRFGWRSIE